MSPNLFSGDDFDPVRDADFAHMEARSTGGGAGAAAWLMIVLGITLVLGLIAAFLWNPDALGAEELQAKMCLPTTLDPIEGHDTMVALDGLGIRGNRAGPYLPGTIYVIRKGARMTFVTAVQFPDVGEVNMMVQDFDGKKARAWKRLGTGECVWEEYPL